jgi:NDP-sugar pyrophosphorylase family protein
MMRETSEFAARKSLADIPAFILVGGFGTRLQSVFNAGPKSMAPVSGKPFLYYLLRTLQHAGFRRVVLCVGYKHAQIQEWAGNGSELGLDIEYSVEAQPLGTGGALRLAVERYGEISTLVAMNGDSLVQLDFLQMLCAHVAHGAVATVGLARVNNTARYGRVDVDEAGRIRAFAEKSGESAPGWINSGVYVFEPEIFADIPAGCVVSLERQVLPSLINRRRLCSFSTQGRFIDIGIPEEFARAQTEMKEIFQLW